MNDTTRNRLLYAASLPERLPRAFGSGVGGLLYESSLVLLPEVARRSQVYQALVGRMLRITVEWLGGVQGVTPADPMTAGRLTVRKVAGNVVEFTSIVTVGWSPLWMLAAASDLTNGTKAYLHALTDELKRLELLPPDVEFASVDGLLEALGGTTGVLSKFIDIPPLERQELEVSIREMRESWETLRANMPGLPSAERLNAIAQQMQQTAEREHISVWMVSALLGLGALQAGVKLGQVHVYDYYRHAMAEIWEGDLAGYINRVSKPYVAKTAEHLNPRRTSYTEFALKRILRQRTRPALPPPARRPDHNIA